MNASNNHASDNALMVRYQRGDLGAYGELVQRHLQGVFTIASYTVRGGAAAEELTLRVFAEFARRSGEFRDQIPFSTWLYRLAVSVPAPPNAQQQEAEATESVAVISTLPHEQRTVFLLKQVANLEFAQIATVIGTDVQDVKERMRKALLALQKTLQERRALGENPKRAGQHHPRG